MKLKFKNIYLAIKDQLPLSRLLDNLKSGRILGLISEYSHIKKDGSKKIQYNTKTTAYEKAKIMKDKTGNDFSVYCCLYCGKYHIGKSFNVNSG